MSMWGYGKVKSLRLTFGFLVADADGAELFFHGGALVKPLRIEDLRVGDAVIFDEEPNPRGTRATNITLAT